MESANASSCDGLHSHAPSEGESHLEAAVRALRKLSDEERQQVIGRVCVSEQSCQNGRVTGQPLLIEYVDRIVLLTCSGIALNLLRLLVADFRRHRKQDRNRAFSDYLKYRFSIWYSQKSAASFWVLAFLSICLLVIGASLHTLLTGEEMAGSLWKAWLWIAAPDGGGSADGTNARVAGVVISCGGMLVFALLMSTVSSTFEDVLDVFKHKGLPVVDSGHIVVLGWNPMVPCLISELCTAHEDAGGCVIALLTPLGKQNLEDKFNELNVSTKNSEVVVRSGDRRQEDDLNSVSVCTASTILVLSRCKISREDSDARQINVLLTLQGMGLRENCKVIVQCQMVDNFEMLANGPHIGAKMRCIPVLTGSFLGALMVKSTFQSGLAQAMSQIVGFQGSEFYLAKVDGIAGKKFRDALLGMSGGIAVGLSSSEGELELVPAMSTSLRGMERIIVFADGYEAVNSLRVGNCIEARSSGSSKKIQKRQESRTTSPLRSSDLPTQRMSTTTRSAETIVIVGWNEFLGSILHELDRLLMPGSRVVTLSPQALDKRENFINATLKQSHKEKYVKFSLEHVVGELAGRTSLQELPLDVTSKVLILADSSSAEPRDADGSSIAVASQVLHLTAERRKSCQLPVIVSQVYLQKTSIHFRNMGLHDCILSDHLAAAICAQVACSEETYALCQELLSDSGCSLAVRPVGEFPSRPQELLSPKVSFQQVQARAARSGEIALGWRHLESEAWDMNPTNVTELVDSDVSVVVMHAPTNGKAAEVSNQTPVLHHGYKADFLETLAYEEELSEEEDPVDDANCDLTSITGGLREIVHRDEV